MVSAVLCAVANIDCNLHVPILQFPGCFSQLNRYTDCTGLLGNVKPCVLTEWNLYVWGVCV